MNDKEVLPVNDQIQGEMPKKPLERALTDDSFEKLHHEVIGWFLRGLITEKEGFRLLSDADKERHWSDDELDD